MNEPKTLDEKFMEAGGSVRTIELIRKALDEE